MGLKTESGASVPEYAILLAGIAVACVFGLLVLGAGIEGLFKSDTPDTPSFQGPMTPPAKPPTLTYPTKLADCENGGWRNFPQFRDEAACRRYVESLRP